MQRKVRVVEGRCCLERGLNSIELFLIAVIEFVCRVPHSLQ